MREQTSGYSGFFIIFAFETAISETAVSKNSIKKKL